MERLIKLPHSGDCLDIPSGDRWVAPRILLFGLWRLRRLFFGWGPRCVSLPASQGSYLILLLLLFIYHVLSCFCFVLRVIENLHANHHQYDVQGSTVGLCQLKMQHLRQQPFGGSHPLVMQSYCVFHCISKETGCLNTHSSSVYDLSCQHIFFFLGSDSIASLCLLESYISRGRA